MDWFDKAQQLHGAGMGYRRIGKELDISPKTVESRFLRYKKQNGTTEHKEVNIQDSILKDIQKECAISYLCDKYKQSERIIRAYIDDITESGYMVTEISGTVKLNKTTMPQDNTHNEEWKGIRNIKFAAISDLHWGSKWQQKTYCNELFAYSRKKA